MSLKVRMGDGDLSDVLGVTLPWEIHTRFTQESRQVQEKLISIFVFLLAITLTSQAIGYSRSLFPAAKLAIIQSETEDLVLQEGEKYFAQGDWVAAETHFKSALKRQPFSPLWHVCLAVALDKQRKSKEAHAEMKKLVEIRRIESLLAYLEKSKTGKIAFVDTRFFKDEKDGISRFVAALKSLDDEFKDQLDELGKLDARIKANEIELATSDSGQDPTVTQTKQEEVRRLKRELERKRKDAKAAYEKRSEKVIGSVSIDIGNALQSYAKERDIAYLLDSSVFPKARFLADKSVDVTQDFVSTYNKSFPK
jgi:Skp family chaperone for outer membrane proteins